MNEDSMPSKRRVPEQEIAELSDALTVARSNAETWRNSMYALEERVLELTEQRDRAMRMLREPSEELQEHLAEAFDDAFVPAWRACIKKHGRDNVQPAWSAWGKQYLNAIAAALDAEAAAETAPSLPETP